MITGNRKKTKRNSIFLSRTENGSALSGIQRKMITDPIKLTFMINFHIENVVISILPFCVLKRYNTLTEWNISL